MTLSLSMNDPKKFEKFLKRLFVRLDTNKDGSLDFNETKKLIQIFTNCTDFELKQQFEKLDQNHDGVLSFVEFKVMFESVLDRLEKNSKAKTL